MAKKKVAKKKSKLKSGWEKLPGIKGGSGGCLHCGYQHSTLPVNDNFIIAVGFGDASLTKGNETVYKEQTDPEHWEDVITSSKAEEIAAADPDHDWRIHLIAPLSERHYQRQGEKHWVLYEKGLGFA